jgi:hypothetical protein
MEACRAWPSRNVPAGHLNRTEKEREKENERERRERGREEGEEKMEKRDRESV